MSKTNAKSLNAMKQNIKKNNQQYENEIAKYLETPEEEEAAEAAESDSDSDSENESGSSSSDSESEDEAKKKKDGSDSDSGSESGSDSDSDWGSDSSSSSSDEDPAMAGKTGMSKWMKTPGQEDSDDEFETVKKPKEKKERVIRAPKEEKVQEEKPKEQMVLNEENVKKKLEEMIAQRGRKGTSRKEQMQQLELLATAKISPSMTAQVLVHLIAAQFDSSITRGGVIHMPVSFEVTETDGDKTITRESRDNCVWTRCMGNIEKLLTVLKENPELTEDATGQASSAANKEAQQQAQAMMDEDDDEQPMVVAANLVGFLERLDDELYLSLRMTDNHSADFLRRLLDIAPLLALAEKVQMYYVEIGNNAVAARVAMRRLEHLYYKHNDIVALAAKTRPQEGDRADNRSAYIEDIAMHLYRYGDDTIKTRTMLCHIYYLALHDDFYRARDMMLMSHLQETISKHPVPAMILFNRTMAQLGLSAFRNGLIQEAHGCFDELCSNNRLKELLAQGLTNQRYGDKTQEQERAEKRRQTPYHMHINLELIECCHLVGAILIEIPEMVANAYDTKRKVSSRALRRVFENSDRNPLAGPPENTRDVIMTGARALEKGDWQSCEKFVLGLPVWTHLGNEECVAKALAVMRQKIKEEALRTFLFAYSAYYEALSLNQLCEMFDLTKKTVNSLVSKMIFSDELYASWDQPTASIVMHKKERSRLHHMALNYADQLGKLVDHNEKAWDNRFAPPPPPSRTDWTCLSSLLPY